MKRRIVMLLVFLLLGAIVNIAVAWGCAGFYRITANDLAHERIARDVIDLRWQNDGVMLTYLLLGEWGERDDAVEKSVRLECGWPLRGLCCQSNGRQSSKPINDLLIGSNTGIAIANRPLPLLPIWPGFAINTLFYAAILWLLLALPGVLRRWRRIKRGLCPACAYPVGASDLCTECGRPIPSPLRERAMQRPASS